MGDVSALATPWVGARTGRPPFAEAAERNLDHVRRYLLVFTGDHALADDLAAETFERAFRRWRRYDPRRGPELPWLCGIARRVALDHFRAESRRRRREERFARDPEGARELVGEAREEAKRALAELRDLARGLRPSLLAERGLGPALTALAGGLLMSFQQVDPTMGLRFGLLSWCILALTGLGSIPGLLISGIIVGTAESLAIGLWDPRSRSLIIYLIFVLVLWLRPRGLFGRK